MSTSNGFVLILFPFHISFISDIAVMILKLRKFFLLGCFLSHKNDDFFFNVNRGTSAFSTLLM